MALIQESVKSNSFVFVEAKNICTADPIDLNTISIVTQPTHGTVRIELLGINAGKILYTPNSNYLGLDSFQFTADDTGAVNCGTHDVHIEVTDAKFLIIDEITYCVIETPQVKETAAQEIQTGLSGRPKRIRYGDHKRRFEWSGSLYFDSKNEAIAAIELFWNRECFTVSGKSIPRFGNTECFLDVGDLNPQLRKDISTGSGTKNSWYIDITLKDIDGRLYDGVITSPDDLGIPAIYEYVMNDLEALAYTHTQGYNEGADPPLEDRISSIPLNNTSITNNVVTVGLNTSFANGSDQLRFLSGSNARAQVGSSSVQTQLQTPEFSFALVITPKYNFSTNVYPLIKDVSNLGGSYYLRQTSAVANDRNFVLTSNHGGNAVVTGSFAWTDDLTYVIIGVMGDGDQRLYVNDGVTPVGANAAVGTLDNLATETLLRGDLVRVSYLKGWADVLSPSSVTVVMNSLKATYGVA